MKIGIDAHGVGGKSLGCGNETYFGNLIQQLLRLDAENEYHIFTNQPAYLEERVGPCANVKYVTLQPRSQWVQRPISVPWYVSRHGLDVLHFPFIRPPFTRAKCIITVHDICFETHPEHFRRLEVLRMRSLIPGSCRRADCIFTVSEFARRQIHELYGIPLERIVVTPNAADHMKTHSAGDLPADAGVPAPFILYAGLLQPRKNLVRLVRAFEDLKRRASMPHHLVLCGKWGWGNEELRRVIERSPQKHCIHVLGYVPEWRLRALMAKAAVFAFPSIFEGFGIPPMEAQRYRVPVVVSHSSCFPEVYADSAEYCDPLDTASISRALQKVLLDSHLRELLIARGALNWRRFSWSKTAALVLEQYHSIHRHGVPAMPSQALGATAGAF